MRKYLKNVDWINPNNLMFSMTPFYPIEYMYLTFKTKLKVTNH